MPADTKARAAGACGEVTLEDLALLAEFDGDPDATELLLRCLEQRFPLDHTAERIRQDRAEAARHQQIRADLQAAGITITDSLPDGAAWLTSLTHDGDDLGLGEITCGQRDVSAGSTQHAVDAAVRGLHAVIGHRSNYDN